MKIETGYICLGKIRGDQKSGLLNRPSNKEKAISHPVIQGALFTAEGRAQDRKVRKMGETSEKSCLPILVECKWKRSTVRGI